MSISITINGIEINIEERQKEYPDDKTSFDLEMINGMRDAISAVIYVDEIPALITALEAVVFLHNERELS